MLRAYSALAAILTLGPGLPLAGAQSAWRDTRLPGEAKVTSLHSLPGILLAGTENGNIYRSKDGGREWVATVPRSPRPIVAFLTVDSVTLAASGMEAHSGLADCFGDCPRWVDMGGVYRSTDGGITWNLSGPPETLAFALQERILFAATLRGTYRSLDLGRTWRRLGESFLPIGGATPYPYGITRLSLLGNRIFAWNRWSRSMGQGTVSGDSLVWSRWETVEAMTVRDGWLLACRVRQEDTSRTYHVERSRNGTTWQSLSRLRLEGLETRDSLLYGYGQGQVYSSRDGGMTWIPDGPSPSPLAPNAFIIPLQGGGLGGYGHGIPGVQLRAPGSGTWEPANGGLHDRPVFALSFLHGTLLAGSWYTGLLFAPPSGGWKVIGRVGQGVTRNAPLTRFGDKVLYPDAGLQVSATGAPGTWQTLASGYLKGVAASPAWAAAFESHLSITVCEAGAACRRVTPAHLPPAYLQTPISKVERNAYRGMAISGDSLYLLLDSLYLSTDRAATWTPVAPGAPADPGAFSVHHGRLLLGGVPGFDQPRQAGLLWAWDPATRTWSEAGVDGFSAPGSVTAMVSRAAELYVATDSGLYLRGPDPAGWTDLSAGLPCRGVTRLAVEGDRLAAGTACGPVLVRDLEPSSARRPPRPARKPLTYPTGYFGDGGGAWRRIDGRAVVPVTPR